MIVFAVTLVASLITALICIVMTVQEYQYGIRRRDRLARRAEPWRPERGGKG